MPIACGVLSPYGFISLQLSCTHVADVFDDEIRRKETFSVTVNVWTGASVEPSVQKWSVGSCERPVSV